MNLVIWDLAGQSKYRERNLKFYEGALGAFYVFDLGHFRTFEDIKVGWSKLLVKNMVKEIPTILIGNKSDLIKKREVDYDMGLSLANELGSLSYIETSAKNGDNVNLAFKNISNAILRNLENNL